MSLFLPAFRVFSRNYRASSWMRTPLLPQSGPDLKDFLRGRTSYDSSVPEVPYLDPSLLRGDGLKVYIDVHGCQMNVSDTEIVWSILQAAGYDKTDSSAHADVILVMTCAIRDRAETKIWNKLTHYRGLKRSRSQKKNFPPLQIGILGCMAERLKSELVEKERSVDLVAGPDSYRDLPRLLATASLTGQPAINVALSLDETYADIVPVRMSADGVTAYVSIMRGCDNMCTYCIVPFTRGRERSRPIESILAEVGHLSEQGVKEVTLLGQNVNSYRDTTSSDSDPNAQTITAKGFSTVYKPKRGGLRFAHLLDRVASVDPEMRIRFTSPHPKDFPDEVLEVIRSRPNICCSLHLPAQSGNDRVLERMRRGYTRRSYLDLVERVRRVLPSVALSSDFICGFCGETDSEFEDTLSLIRQVGFNTAYLFAYSMREKTTAHRRYQDDVPPEVKQRRLVAMVSTFREEAATLNKSLVGKQQTVLVEGESKRSDKFLAGRNDGNIKVIVPSVEIPSSEGSDSTAPIKSGSYISVKIEEASSQVLKGRPLYHTTLASSSRS